MAKLSIAEMTEIFGKTIPAPFLTLNEAASEDMPKETLLGLANVFNQVAHDERVKLGVAHLTRCYHRFMADINQPLELQIKPDDLQQLKFCFTVAMCDLFNNLDASEKENSNDQGNDSRNPSGG